MAGWPAGLAPILGRARPADHPTHEVVAQLVPDPVAADPEPDLPFGGGEGVPEVQLAEPGGLERLTPLLLLPCVRRKLARRDVTDPIGLRARTPAERREQSLRLV